MAPVMSLKRRVVDVLAAVKLNIAVVQAALLNLMELVAGTVEPVSVCTIKSSRHGDERGRAGQPSTAGVSPSFFHSFSAIFNRFSITSLVAW